MTLEEDFHTIIDNAFQAWFVAGVILIGFFSFVESVIVFCMETFGSTCQINGIKDNTRVLIDERRKNAMLSVNAQSSKTWSKKDDVKKSKKNVSIFVKQNVKGTDDF